MKTFKVKEKFLVTGWTFVKAETEEAAQKIIDDGDASDFREEDSNHEETIWSTLQEVGNARS